MESPVRICLGAALVVILLLLSSTKVNGNVIPHDTTSTTPREERLPIMNRVKTPDVSLNELNSKIKPKVLTSEENAKYKDRGRGNVKFHSQVKSSTESNFRRVRTTEAAKLLIVTPIPEVKKPADIVDSMRIYKKNKIPNIIPSSTSTIAAKDDEQSAEEYEDDDDDENEEESSEKFTSNFDSFFSIPSFSKFTHDSDFDSSNKKIKYDFGSSTYGGFSSLFPHQASYGFSEPTHDSFKSEFFDHSNYEGELTTPKNDFFDKKFSKVSNSIIKNLDILKAKTAPPNITNVHKITKHNLDLQNLGNTSKPGNKTVFIKNTKEIHLLDNDGASSATKELSDMHGTSIYYEMSVLSTETYAINNSDDDCDDESLPSDPTPSTSMEEEQASLKTARLALPLATRPALPDPNPKVLSTLSSSFLPAPSVLPTYDTINPIPVSTQNSISSTDNSKVYSNTFNRNRHYSKRLNLNRNKDSPNSVTSKPVVISSSLSPRQQTRKFHHTTPKSKPVWIVPRRNITRIRPTIASPIYMEHFSARDKLTTRPRLSSPFFSRPSKSSLTTVSSDIDPILQGYMGGEKKVVQSQSISDNSVASLSKRGSMKFGTSTGSSKEMAAESEMPPTAWALASLRIPPAMPDMVANSTKSAHKSFDENELQNVGEVTDNKEIAIISMSTTTANPLSNDIVPKNITDIDQNKLPWQPITVPTLNNDSQMETKPEQPATTSNISEENIVEESVTTEQTIKSEIETDTPWVPVVHEDESTEENDIETETIPSVDTTKQTSFESITKLGADITTPQDESVASSKVNQTVIEQKLKAATPEYEITTIRFSYVPSEETTNSDTDMETTETVVPTTWHPVFPTRTKITTIEDSPITTYRPTYTSTEEEETTTFFIETSSPIEVSSQVLENNSKLLANTTQTTVETTESPSETPTTMEMTTMAVTEEITTQPSIDEVTTQSDINESTTISKPTTTTEPTTSISVSETITITPSPTTTPITTTPESPITTQTPTTTITADIVEDTTTIVVEVVTEINTVRQQRITSTTTSLSETTETSFSDYQDTGYGDTSGNNEVTTQETVKPTTFEISTPESVTIVPPVTRKTNAEIPNTEPSTTTEVSEEITTHSNAKIHDTTMVDTTTEIEYTTKSVSRLEDQTNYPGELTTEHASVKMDNEEVSESGAGIAIAVSTIGVIALVLLIGLLLIVRRRGRRGVYAQRCTPVSLDAYSLDSVSVGHRKGNHRLRASKRSYGNPAYDDEVTSHPMQYAALANFALDVESMSTEFAEIPSVTVRPDEVPPGCEDKNRYSNVLPLPETRVPLKRIGSDPTTEYINANYITGPGNIRNYYIACQAPLSNTVVDFWRMIWEQNSRLIVMLTEYMENGVEKCYEYLPPSEISDNKRTFGDFQIILKKREQRDKYAVSSVQLINLATRTWREITHLWYFWPAKGVPEDYDSIIDFLCEMRSYMKISQTAKEYDEEGVEVIYGDQNRSSFSNLSKFRSDEGNSGNGVNVYSPAKAEQQLRRLPPNNGTLGRMKAAAEIDGIRPCVVTCASGAGRTAALVALDICTRALPGAADVPRVVRHLRAQRPHSLSNRHHYIFVYKVLSEYGNKMLGGGVDTI